MNGVLRVAILGAESSGKSTLAAALATHYGTVWVPEYLREFVDTQGAGAVRDTTSIDIARTQMEREDAAARQASALPVLRHHAADDGDLQPLVLGQGRCAAGATLELAHDYAFTLVTAPDSPWDAGRPAARIGGGAPGGARRGGADAGRARDPLHAGRRGSLPQRLLQADRFLQVAACRSRSRTAPTP